MCASDDPARRARPRSTASAGTRPASAHRRDRRGSVPAAPAGPGLGARRASRRARRASPAGGASSACVSVSRASRNHGVSPGSAAATWRRATCRQARLATYYGGVPDTIVFIPAWNEEENLPAVLDELAAGLPAADVLVVDDGSTDRTAEIAAEQRRAGALVRREPRPPRRDRSRVRVRARARLRLRRPRRRRRPAPGRTSSRACSRSFARARPTSPSARASSAATGYAEYRYEPSPSRRFGTALLRRGMKAALGRPVPRRDQRDVRGQRAARCRSSPSRTRAARPRSSRCSGCSEAGLTVVEVPVDMRERASGESKLQRQEGRPARRDRRRHARCSTACGGGAAR